jgi:DNA-binding NarL/FixJ family response regulator
MNLAKSSLEARSKRENLFHGDEKVRPANILVADRHPVVRAGLRRIIEARPTWKLVAEFGDGAEALRNVLDTRPDVAILGRRLTGLNAVLTTSKIRDLVPDTKVLIFATGATEADVRDALNAGAHGYIRKADGIQQLVSAIQALLHHKPFLSETVSLLLPESKSSRTANNGSILTGRERMVLQLLAEGQRSKEIAYDLAISLRTVETHRANMMRKLNMSSMAEMVRFAVRHHIVDP